MESQEDDICRGNLFRGCTTDLGAQLGEPRKRGVIRFVHQYLGRKQPSVAPPTHEDARHAASPDKSCTHVFMTHVVLQMRGLFRSH
jgi:hypothetical protein